VPALVARRPWAAVVFLVIAGLVAGVGIHPPAARAASTHRALVVVNTGTRVFHRCVGFSSDTITGRQALDQADVQPVYSGYGNQGTAVCSLCGTGCPSDNCFCDPDRYWRYYRQPSGTSSVAYASQGAGATKVHDGDVEHWSWAKTSDPGPGADNIDTYCAPVTPQSTPTTSAGAPPTQPPAGGKAGSTPTTGQQGIAGTVTTTGSAAEAGPTSSSSTSTTGTGSHDRAIGASSSRSAGHNKRSSSSGAGAAGAVGFATALAALAAAFVFARRSRNRRGLPTADDE
jgi:hypothetical protein